MSSSASARSNPRACRSPARARYKAAEGLDADEVAHTPVERDCSFSRIRSSRPSAGPFLPTCSPHDSPPPPRAQSARRRCRSIFPETLKSPTWQCHAAALGAERSEPNATSNFWDQDRCRTPLRGARNGPVAPERYPAARGAGGVSSITRRRRWPPRDTRRGRSGTRRFVAGSGRSHAEPFREPGENLKSAWLRDRAAHPASTSASIVRGLITRSRNQIDEHVRRTRARSPRTSCAPAARRAPRDR